MSERGDSLERVSIKGFEQTREAPFPLSRFSADVTQAAVIGLPDGVSAAVIGAPGSGKTATLVELVAERVGRPGWSASEIVALTTNRVSATRLRDALALRLGVPTSGPLARTVNSLAFEIVGAAAAA